MASSLMDSQKHQVQSCPALQCLGRRMEKQAVEENPSLPLWGHTLHVYSCVQTCAILLTAKFKLWRKSLAPGSGNQQPSCSTHTAAWPLFTQDSGEGVCVWEEILQPVCYCDQEQLTDCIKSRANQWLTENHLSSPLFSLCIGAKGLWGNSQNCWHWSSDTSHWLLCSSWNISADARQKKSEKWREMCGDPLKGCGVLCNMEIKSSLKMGWLMFTGSHWKLFSYLLKAMLYFWDFFVYPFFLYISCSVVPL